MVSYGKWIFNNYQFQKCKDNKLSIDVIMSNHDGRIVLSHLIQLE